MVAYYIRLIVRRRYFNQRKLWSFGRNFFTKSITTHQLANPYFVASLLETTEKRLIDIFNCSNVLQAPTVSLMIPTGQPGTLPCHKTPSTRIGNYFRNSSMVHQTKMLCVQRTLVSAQNSSTYIGFRKRCALRIGLTVPPKSVIYTDPGATWSALFFKRHFV